MNTINNNYYDIIDKIFRSSNHMTESVSQLLKPKGITEPQYNVLRILEDHQGPLSVQSIGQDMYKKSSNITRIIDKLLHKGYVSREVCAHNRRQMDIALTPEGLQIVSECNTLIRAFHVAYEDNLSHEERDQLIKLLSKLFNDL